MNLKRFGCLILSMIMLFSNMCVSAFAIEDNTYQSGDFIYCLDDDSNAIIMGLSEEGQNSTHIIIPESIDGNLVTGINQKAFQKNSNIEEVTIPSTISKIGTLAFKNCSNLKTVNYNTLTVPELYFTNEGIFGGCPIETVNLGAGITSIPDGLLSMVSSVDIIINSEDELTSIDKAAFFKTANLNSITFTNSKISNISDNAFKLSNVSHIKSSTISLNSGVLDLADTIYIGNSVFEGMSMEEVTIPSTISEIGSLAFKNCLNLKTVNYNTTINPAIYFTGEGVFSGCPIETVNLGEGITIISSLVAGITSTEITVNSIEKVFKIDNDAFSNTDNLEKITITNSDISIIGNFAFKNASSLKEIVDNNINLKNGVLTLNNIISIGADAFEGMSMEEVTIPSTVTGIDYLAFYNCLNLKTLNYDSYIIPKAYFTGSGVFGGCPIENVNLGAGITSIPDYLLAYTTADTVVINSMDTITTVGSNAFSNNPNLSSVEFKNSLLTDINDKAFLNTGLTAYTIPDSVLNIGNGAFSNCNNLKYVELLNDVAPHIGNEAFKNMADKSVIKVKNPDIAAAFSNSNYSIDKTTIKIGNEIHIVYRTDGDGKITRNGLTDTTIAAIIENSEDLYDTIATSNPGSRFVKWIDSDGNMITTSPVLSFDMPTEDKTYTAVFEKIEYILEFNIDERYGTIKNPKLIKYYGDYVSNDEIGLDIKPGYTFKGWIKDGSIINTLRVFENGSYTASFDISKYKYNINVYYNGELYDTISDTEYVDTVITDYKKYTVPAFWKFERVENAPLTISSDESKNNINVYYILDTENYSTYKIEYYYDDILEDTLTYTVPIGTIVEKVTLRDKAGYTFDSVEGLPLCVTDSNGIIKMKYNKDNNPEYTLTIEYYYNDVIDSSKTETIKIPSGTKFSQLVSKVDYNTVTGYEYKSLEYIIPESYDGNLYKVEYYYDGVIDDSLTETDVNLPDIDNKIVQNTKNGYVFVDMTQFSNIKINVDGIKIKVKYETENFNPSANDYVTFKVQYYYSDNKFSSDLSGARLDDTQTDIISIPKGTIIKGIKNKTKDTHVLVKINSVPMTIDRDGLIIKAYYLPIGTQIPGINSRFEAEYPYNPDKPFPSLGDEFYSKIEKNESGESVIRIYYKSQTSDYTVNYYFDGEKDESLSETKTVLTGTVIDTYVDKNKENYVFDKVIGLPLTVSADGGNIINVYYKHKTSDYVVEYYYDNVLNTSKTEINTIKVGTIISSYVDKIEPGYKLDKVTGLPLTVSLEGDNTIRVYYKTSTASYTVEYYYDGILDDSLTDTFNGEIGTNIKTYADKCKAGYNFDKVTGLPLTIGSGTIIKVYYSKIPVLMANYSIEYYYDGIMDSSKTEEGYVIDGTIISTYPDKAGTDYSLDKVINLPLTVKTNYENIIKVYYKSINLTYTVEYYYDNKIDSSKTDIYKVSAGSFINNYVDKCIPGYRLDKVVGLPLTVDVSGKTIKVYYEKIPEIETIEYTVEYYYDNIIDNSLTDIKSVIPNTVIRNVKDKCKAGYELEKIDTLPLTVMENCYNLIRVYYKTIKIIPNIDDYVIEYYFDGVLDNSLTIYGTAAVGTIINSYPDKCKDGYAFDHVEGFPLTVGTNRFIKVYYLSKEVNYTVNYFYNYNLEISETFSSKIGEVINTVSEKNRTGYRLYKIDKLPLVLTEKDNIINVYYVSEDTVQTGIPNKRVVMNILGICTTIGFIYLFRKKKHR